MCDLLSFEADRRAVNITVNRWSTDFSVSDLTFFFFHMDICFDIVLIFMPHFEVLGPSWLEMIARSCTPTLVYCMFSLRATLVVFLSEAFLFLMWMSYFGILQVSIWSWRTCSLRRCWSGLYLIMFNVQWQNFLFNC
jgi:hypothetical protein